VITWLKPGANENNFISAARAPALLKATSMRDNLKR
jgi:hypothetical protein